jgi:hypothetical protein
MIRISILRISNSPYARSGKKLSFLKKKKLSFGGTETTAKKLSFLKKKKLSFGGTETTAKKLSFFKKLSFCDAVA